MQALDLLNSKIDMLLKKFAALEAENKRLKATIATQDKSLELLTKKLAALEQGMGNVKLGGAIMDDEEKELMRNQLDIVIGEIDKILGALNE